jgi:hypothetical protein
MRGAGQLEGAYTVGNFSGRLEIEISGTTPGAEYDQLISTDPTNLITIGTSGTTLDVSLTRSFRRRTIHVQPDTPSSDLRHRR